MKKRFLLVVVAMIIGVNLYANAGNERENSGSDIHINLLQKSNEIFEYNNNVNVVPENDDLTEVSLENTKLVIDTLK